MGGGINMKRRWLTVALIACVIGAVCAFISLDRYLEIQKSGVAEASFCSVSDFIDCDIVEASSYASINGLPVAGIGFVYYIFMFLFVFVGRFFKGFKMPTVAFVWWASVLSIIYTIYMAYISMSVLNVICLTCAGMYVANLLLFVSLYLAMGMPLKECVSFIWGYWATIITNKKRGIDFMPKFWTHLLSAVIIFGIGMIFITSAAKNIGSPNQEEIAGYVGRHFRQSKYDLKFDKNNTPMWGTKGAPVTIVEFSDFECPYCKIAAFRVKPFLVEFKKDVAFYFLNYPLDSTCNHYMQHQMHPGACLAAKAVICANAEGKFWEYHNALFRNKGRIDDELIKKITRNLKLSEAAFNECLADPATERKLQDDIEAARRIYVSGTPSVFINDRNLKAWKSPEILRAVVENELISMPPSGKKPVNPPKSK